MTERPRGRPIRSERSRFEREMAEELEFHLQARIDDLVGTGLSRREAERRARIVFASGARCSRSRPAA